MHSTIKALEQGAKCIYIAVEESVADDISQRMLNGAREIQRLHDLHLERTKLTHKALQDAERLQSRVEVLEGALNSAVGALNYYTDVNYDVSSDVQVGYGLAVLDDLAEAIDNTGDNSNG